MVFGQVFDKQKEMLVEFERLSAQLSAGSADMLNRVMPKDNIAIGAVLVHKATQTPLFVGNAHLHWDPNFSDVKVRYTPRSSKRILRPRIFSLSCSYSFFWH